RAAGSRRDLHGNGVQTCALPICRAGCARGRGGCAAISAIVLFLFFLPEWQRILRGLGRSLRDREISPGDADARLAWLLVVGTIPAGLLGLLFEHPLRSLFANPKAAAVFLALNGLILFASEL